MDSLAFYFQLGLFLKGREGISDLTFLPYLMKETGKQRNHSLHLRTLLELRLSDKRLQVDLSKTGTSERGRKEDLKIRAFRRPERNEKARALSISLFLHQRVKDHFLLYVI